VWDGINGYSGDTLNSFMNFLIKNPGLYYAHNAAKAEFLILLKILRKYDLFFQGLLVAGRLIQIRGKGFEMRDSVKLIPESVEKIAERMEDKKYELDYEHIENESKERKGFLLQLEV